MSNFNCEKCGMPIIENKDGVYITDCSHYPLDYLNNNKSFDIDLFFRLGSFIIDSPENTG